MKLPPLSPGPPPGTHPSAPPAATGSKLPAVAPAIDDMANDTATLQQLADKLTQTIGMNGQHVQFSVDDATGKTVLRVTDAESGAVLRQIPGDEALSMARILDRMQGVLIRQKA